MFEKYIAAVIQLDTTTCYEDNLKAAVDFIGEAHARGAKLVTLPENWTYQGDDYLDYAEEMPGGRLATTLSGMAKKYGMWIHSGSSSEKNPNPEDPRPCNTSMLFNPKGELAAKYRKVHASNMDVAGAHAYRESDHKCPGNEIVVYDTHEAGKLGFSICYDLRFPELYRLMAMEGAEIFLVPSSFYLMTGKAAGTHSAYGKNDCGHYLRHDGAPSVPLVKAADQDGYTEEEAKAEALRCFKCDCDTAKTPARCSNGTGKSPTGSLWRSLQIRRPQRRSPPARSRGRRIPAISAANASPSARRMWTSARSCSSAAPIG
jgi:predicted amidohydrolase